MNITDNEITGRQGESEDRPIGIQPISNAEGTPVDNDDNDKAGDNTGDADEEESKPYTGGIIDDDTDHVENEDDLREIRVDDDLGEPDAEHAESHVRENDSEDGDAAATA